MLDATVSGCINHPGVEATGRCKQCGRPFCGACEIRGTTGRFCSDVCRQKHEQFMARAQQTANHGPRPGLLHRVKTLVLKLVALVLAVGAIGFALAYFNVPVAGRIARGLFQIIGVNLPTY